MKAILRIQGVKLPVRLGCEAKERERPQWVTWDVECQFKNLPTACETDNLQDTICYDQLTRRLAAVCERQEYHLIEHLAAKGLKEIEPILLSVIEVRILVRKLAPPIAFENQGSSFEIVKSF